MPNAPRTLTIAALSTPRTISLAALEACQSAPQLFVQTAETPCVLPLVARGLSFTSMDDLYACAEDFDALNTAIADRLFDALMQSDAVYAVPGACMGEAGFTALKARAAAIGAKVCFISGAGYARAAAADAGMAFDSGVIAVAVALPRYIDISLPLFVEELDTRVRAGEVKLALMEYYPDAHRVYFCTMQPDGAYNAAEIPLYELDRQAGYHAAAALIVPPVNARALSRHGFFELVELVRTLRTHCPWDKKQTHRTLTKALIEECYEVIDAIEREDDDALCEELGDVLLQCVFHAEIASEQRRFHMRDVTTGIVEKLVYRHPHIFGAVEADTPEQVLKNWEDLKKKEKGFSTCAEAMRAIPANLPALMRANKIQKKAAGVGFDWPRPEDALLKLREETAELEAAMAGDGDAAEEMGDILFSAVNVARLLQLEPEELLRSASEKFMDRFARMEALAEESGWIFKETTPSEQNELWDRIKTTQIRQK